MDVKDKLKIPRQKMPEQDPRVRARNFLEVPLGFSPKVAQLEAQRCLNCKVPKCIEGCPVGVKIPEFLKLIVDGDFAAAVEAVKDLGKHVENAFPRKGLSRHLWSACDRFVELDEDLIDQCRITPIS